MTHEWLTEKDIKRIVLWSESAYDELDRILADMKRLMTDRSMMRELLLSVETQLPVCTRDREDIEDMREVTADD